MPSNSTSLSTTSTRSANPTLRVQFRSVSVFQNFGGRRRCGGRKAEILRICPGRPTNCKSEILRFWIPAPLTRCLATAGSDRVPFRPLANPRAPRRTASNWFGTPARPDPRNVPPPAFIVSRSLESHLVSDHLHSQSAPPPNNFVRNTLEIWSNNVRLWQAFNG